MKTRHLFAWFIVLSVLPSCGGRPTGSVADEKTEASTKNRSSAEAASDTIELSPEAQRRVGVAVTPVTETALALPLAATGSVQPIDSRVSHVRPLARGRIQQVAVKVGDRVQLGQTLASFDNIEAGELATQYAGARADLARLRVQLAAAARQTERAKQLVDIGAVSQKDVEASVSEQQQLDESVRAQEASLNGMEARLRRYGAGPADLTNPAGISSAVTALRAPFAGVVTSIAAAPGEVVDAGTELFGLADLSRVYVQAQVYEKDLRGIRLGQPVAASVDAYPGETFAGRVAAVGDVVDPQTRTIPVRCEVDNAKGLLKVNMFAKVELSGDASIRVLVLPTDAVQTLDGKTVVFVRAGAASFEVRSVTLGRTSKDQVEITAGLKPGEPVVTRGSFQVKSARLSKSLGEKE